MKGFNLKKIVYDAVNDTIFIPQEEKKIRKKVIHRNTKKVKRNKKSKRDYIDKESLYDKMIIFIDSNYTDEQSRQFLLLNYYRIAIGMASHKNFYMYEQQMKNDMIMDSVVRGMDKGKKTHEKYGIPYFARFDTDKSDNVFSFFCQTIGNFFLQYLKSHYQYENTKQDHLEKIINDFDVINIRNCNKGVSFQIGSVVDKER